MLILGDCIEEMKKLDDNSVDLCLTDIPYGVVNRKTNGLRNLNKEYADVLTFNLKKALIEADRVTKGSFYIFCSTEQVSQVRSYFANKKYTTRLCIWQKSNPSPMNGQYAWLSGVECFIYAKKKRAVFNEHCKNTVFKYPTPRGKLHPTMKPVNLLKYLIEVSSNENETVLDFTMGSGSTGVACKNLNRKFIGIENNTEYFEIAKKRINDA